MQEYSRTDRVEEQIQRILSDIVRKNVKDPRADMVTINAVRVTRDFSYAKVWISRLVGDEYESATVLNKQSGRIRSMLGKELRLRIIPALTFIADEAPENNQRLSSLIDLAIKQEDSRESEDT